MLDAAQHAVRRANPRGFAQAYVRAGEGGLPLLLLHGWPETKRIWWRNIAALAALGFDVVAPDLRGFGDSDLAPDGWYDVPTHARDLHALLHEALGFERVVAVAGDLGGPIIHDLSLRFPGFIERLVLFNAPLPIWRERMAGLRWLPPRESMDYFIRQGTDADALAAELRTPDERRRYVSAFYGSRHWAHPGAFDEAAVSFMNEPFGDAAKLRASFANYEAVFDPAKRREPARLDENPIRALILFGASDHVIHPDFDRMAALVFPNHVGPFLVRDAGHFVQWEAATLLNGAVHAFCGDRLAGR
jgi:pimeloyl-ACP methyl ester carboxylesterase